jgi:hypothetical protein
MGTAIILGAGFSKCAGLPTQNEFFDLLLAPELSQSPLQQCITRVIEEFLRDVFGWSASQPLPSLEEYFTCIDLSANSGHHLGIKYTPKMLRAVRRMTVHRVLQILDRYQNSPVVAQFLRGVLPGAAGFVVLNWDLVLERGLQEVGVDRIDYGFECCNWESRQRNEFLHQGTPVLKINGSSNWAYCDNCTSMFFDLNRKLALQEMVGLVKADFRLFDEALTGKSFHDALGVTPEDRQCPFCRNMISTHMATFSFAKSYRTHAYPAIWQAARRLLAESTDWLIVGYSLPDADFEFKHMLKSAQLAFEKRRTNQPLKIQVVLKGNERAERRYRGFFGKRIDKIHQGGLQEFARNL